MAHHLNNLLTFLLVAQADATEATASGLDSIKNLLAWGFAIGIGVLGFYIGRGVPRMMVEGKRRLELVSGVVLAFILFYVSQGYLVEAGWGMMLFLVSGTLAVLASYLAPSVAGILGVRGDTFRYVFSMAVFGGLLLASSSLSMVQVEGDAASVDKGFRAFGVFILVISFAYILGRMIVDRMRSPEYTWKVALILATLGIAIVEVAPLDFKYGVDLKGGVNLIYQLKDDGTTERPPIDAMIQALSRRINPGGTREMVLRSYGSSQIEIIIPDAEDSEIAQIKKRITQAGLLQFRIVANNSDHAVLIDKANGEQKGADIIYDDPALPASERTELGQWVRVARDTEEDAQGRRAIKYNATGNVLRNAQTKEPLPPSGQRVRDEAAFDRYLEQLGVEDVEVLMFTDDGFDIEGADLGVVRSGVDENGGPAIDFSMRQSTGAVERFKRMTSQFRPDERQGVTRQLGIVLDNELLSAPTIRSVISERGQISGNFTRDEINFMVGILRAGRLPAVLDEEPISENKMGAELGEETIRKGTVAIAISLVAVVVFIAFYYRFAGVVAVLALATNLLLILALMKMINAAFTLPGLAGLVLTVGMSVDANVLIFERIREELGRGSSLRMAIRNGFGRATITIVDANLTTLITAIVLYMIGTDQIRGFAITLILGILMSMYTAIFCSRAVFELAERSRLINMLRMFSIVGQTSIDFVGKRLVAFFLSVVVIFVGVGAVSSRGKGILAIDFLGGTSVTLQLNKAQTDVEITDRIERVLADPAVQQGMLSDHADNPVQYSIHRVEVTDQTDTAWRIDTSIAKPDKLKEFVQAVFDDNGVSLLSTYQVELGAVASVERQTPTGDRSSGDEDDGASSNETSGCGSDDEETAAVDESPLEEAADEQADPEASDAEEGTDEPGTDGGESTGAEQPVTPAGVSESTAVVRFSIDSGGDYGEVDAVTLREMIKNAADEVGITLSESGIVVVPESAGATVWDQESTEDYPAWSVTLLENVENSSTILEAMKSTVADEPYFHSSSTIGGKVAGDTQQLAIMALLGSLVGIVAYIWFRFQKVAFGLAAVVALVHDVLVTLGAIAVSKWVAIEFLQLEEFRISLPVVAAFLTIIGYSLNDTIVVFDRIREVRGKNPNLTQEMINTSINQTLSRTLLTSLTTLMVVLILYFLGGQGIHGFAFSLMIGVLVGTYSSIFVASPVLLLLVNWGQKAEAQKS